MTSTGANGANGAGTPWRAAEWRPFFAWFASLWLNPPSGGAGSLAWDRRGKETAETRSTQRKDQGGTGGEIGVSERHPTSDGPNRKSQIANLKSKVPVRLIGWLALWKVAYLGLVCAAIALWPRYDEQRARAVNAGWFERFGLHPPPAQSNAFARHFITWDAEHYLCLSEEGYVPGAPSCAFYPLWPLLIRWAAPLFAGNDVLAGMVLSNLLSLAGFALFGWMVGRRFGERTAWLAVAFLALFPGSLFFQFIYSESLFFLLLMLLCLGLEAGRFWLAFAAAFLLPLTRAVGILSLGPILLWLLIRHPPPVLVRWTTRHRRLGWLRDFLGWRDDTPRGNSTGPFEPGASLWSAAASETRRRFGIRLAGRSRDAQPVATAQGADFAKCAAGGCCGAESGVAASLCHRTPKPGGVPKVRYLLVAAPLWGWGLYLLVMCYWTGNPFEGFQAQKYWGVQSISNLWNLPKFILGFYTPTAWHAFTGSLLDRCAFLFVLMWLPLIWRLDKVWFLWALALGVFPAVSGTFCSFTRFASAVFPVFAAMAAWLGTPDRRFMRWLALAAFAALHLVLAWRFLTYRWAG